MGSLHFYSVLVHCLLYVISGKFPRSSFTRGSTESLHVHPSEDGATSLRSYTKLWRYINDKKSWEIILSNYLIKCKIWYNETIDSQQMCSFFFLKVKFTVKSLISKEYRISSIRI